MVKYRFPPIFVHPRKLISIGKYKEFAYDEQGFSDYHPKDMVWKSNQPKGIKVVMNGRYGHRHLLAVKDNKILGITVTSAGWRTELPKWRALGFGPILFEDKEWSRCLAITDLSMASKHDGGYWLGGTPKKYIDVKQIRDLGEITER